jgi:hypothetical protein
MEQIKQDTLAALAAQVWNHHGLAEAARLLGDFEAFTLHASAFHSAASLHDSITGGNIRLIFTAPKILN